MQYRRARVPGACYCFTLKTADPQSHVLVENINLLRKAFSLVKNRHPFVINGIVVLPNQLHTIWTLPEKDSNYPMRWQQIKCYFSRHLPATETINASREQKCERGIWQRRYWEHVVRDEEDFVNHLAYIHNNPVKHGYVVEPQLWPYSSIHKWIKVK